MRASAMSLPQSKSATEGICIAAKARVRRQPIQLSGVTSADHGVLRLERGDQPRHDIGDMTTPLLLAVALQTGPAHVVLKGALLVGKVSELHGLHDAVDDQG